MAGLNSLTATTAAWLIEAIRSKQVSAEEVMQAHLDRIAEVNPKLNALVFPNRQALEQARAADKALAQGESWGPLHGLPFSVKDWIDVAGLPCSGGEAKHRDRIPSQDATAVARLLKAGAIGLGKTAVFDQSEVYGKVYNPYNLAYGTTGSSSGEAALIAAGASPLGLGSDSGGSIRQPAHVCGIAGLKPTSGRIPLSGHFPFISTMADPRTVIGPMARSVHDLALVWPLLAGSDWRDASVVPAPLHDYRRVALGKLRVAFYTRHQGTNPTPQTIATVEQAANALTKVCLSLEERYPPRVEETYPITQDYWNRLESESPLEWQTSGHGKLSGEEVARHLFEWDRFRRALLGFMEHHEVILTPVAELPAQPHGSNYGAIPYTLTYSLTGYPCAVVRCGTSPEGLPIGVQVVARPWREDVALAVAAYLEQTFGGWQAPNL
jgi:amidase